MSRAIRISERAYAALVACAAAEQRTMIAVIDRLLGVTAGMVEPEEPVSLAPAPAQTVAGELGVEGGEEAFSARKAKLQGIIDRIERRPSRAERAAREGRRGSEGEDDQRGGWEEGE